MGATGGVYRDTGSGNSYCYRRFLFFQEGQMEAGKGLRYSQLR
jgi:hypothetical protein